MAAAQSAVEPALMTMEEYLHTSFRPDCDFVDGRVEERNMGETKHSLLQAQLIFWFLSHRCEWKIRALPELRTRVGETRVRLSDVTIAYDDEALAEQVRVTAPLIAIEVLSPEDRIPRVLIRLEDLWKMGIRNVWLLDPVERVAFIYAEGLRRVDSSRIEVAGTPIYLDLSEVFAALD